MSRLVRWKQSGGVYHVINRGINSSWILASPDEKDKFLDLLYKQSRNRNILVYHYALMDNHFHIAAEATSIRELSFWMGTVCAEYSKFWHSKRGGYGTIWQGRFRSIPVQKELYLRRLGRYIERNPLAEKSSSGLTPSSYKWSSASVYTEGRVDLLVKPENNKFWLSCGSGDAERFAVYEEYLNREDSGEVDFENDQLALGDYMFRASLRKVNGRMDCRRGRGRPRKEI